MNNIFDKLIKSNIEKFVSDYINVSRQIFVNENGDLIHPGEFGTYRENIIKSFIKPFLPSRLSIGSGFIITENNNISTQCDIIIYDKNHTPCIENNEQRFFPIECVVGIIEVKSKLSKSQLKEALIKLSNIKKLRSDVNSNIYYFKDHKNPNFNTKLNLRDQIATFLICESIDFNLENNLSTFFCEVYDEIDKSLFHNMILSLKNFCCLYHDSKPFYHSYFDYSKNSLKNTLIKPHENGYEKEHVLLFLQYFYMIISSVSVMYLEITNYLENPRLKTTIIQEDI